MKLSPKLKAVMISMICLVIAMFFPLIVGWGCTGCVSLFRWNRQMYLQKIAEEYVRSTYGDHYYVTNVYVSSASPAIFMEHIYSITYTFSDKNEQESSFQIYVDNSKEKVYDERYQSENISLYKKYVNEYVKNYISEYDLSEDRYHFEITILSMDNEKPFPWEYESYEEMADDENAMKRLNVRFELDIPDTDVDADIYRCAYALYRSLNQAKYEKSEFELSFHSSVQTYTYRGIYQNGEYDADAVPDYANIEYVISPIT